MGVPQKLSGKEDDICLAFLQVFVGLFAVEDESDGADLDPRNGLLDTIGKVNLRMGIKRLIRATVVGRGGMGQTWYPGTAGMSCLE